jgi:hypothetical protein
MTIAACHQLIEERFNTIWGVTTPIAWENVEYTPVSGQQFVTFRILNTYSDFASLGVHPLTRTLGMVEINIYTPVDQGTRPNTTLVDIALSVYKNALGQAWQSGGLRFKVGELTSSNKDDQWFRQIVLVGFTYDEIF